MTICRFIYVCLLPLLLATAAYAADEVDPNGPDPLALEEVVVTATKREESIQEVPMSVTAFTSEFFRDAGVTNLAGLEQYTPSLKINQGTDSNSTSIRIRGIGSVGTNVGIDPSVGMFIDGVYQGRAGMSIGDLIDIQRVEILRGPQGTLYGKNTAAGAISIISMAPSPEALESTVETTYNTDERVEIHAMTNIPLGDSGNATRLTGYVVNGDHLYENTYTGEGINDANKWGIKSRTLFDTSTSDDDGFGEFLLTLDYSKEDTDCCGLAAIQYEGLSTLNTPSTNNPSQQLSDELGLATSGPNKGNPRLSWNSFEDSEGFSPPNADPFSDNYWLDAEMFNKVDVGGVALEWNKDLPNEDVLTFINAWRRYKSDSAYDGDFTAYEAVTGSTDLKYDQYTSELRVTSPGGATIDYQGGLYAFYSELDSTGTVGQSQALVENIEIAPGLPLSLIFPEGTLNTDVNNYKTTSYAAFGQLIWNITDSFSTTLGLRYTYEQKDRVGSQITTPKTANPPDVPPIAGPDVYMDDTRSDDDVSPTLIARYFVKPEIMTYASISRGFKSGGFNQRRELVGKNGEFEPEIATNYELGWKGSSEDRRLQVNGTLYYVNYDDFQAQAFDGSSITVTNAGSLESYGAELELVFVPLADMVVGTAIGYNKATYQDFDNGQCTVDQAFYQYYVVENAQGGTPGTSSNCVQDLAGEPLDNAPEWTVSSFVQYTHDLTEGLMGTVRLEHSYTDSFYLDQDLDPVLENNAVDLVNLRFTVSNMEQTWEAAIWGRNMLDEEYYSFGLDIPVLGGYTGVTAPGEIYGVTVRFNF